MMLALSAKNKLMFVNGTVVRPATGTAEYKAWERCNDLVILWILFNLDETIARSVLFLKSARELWKDLEDHFGFASITQIYSLEQKLSELTQERIHNAQQTQRVLQFLMKLNDHFSAVRANILMMTPIPNIEALLLGTKFLFSNSGIQAKHQ
ncbi:uncharacterized protein LOC141714015 [Apium graveolens]|uniref:uncharacterized protein LOC141714015 n=1 Tax=Apium graveolens TaxID=4045 RepID=UPI003D796442